MYPELLDGEKELLTQIALGDELAFRKLFNFYKDRVYTIGLKITGSPDIAEEIVQDVFLKVWLKREVLTEVIFFRSWLFTITRNRIFDILKRQAREQKKTRGLVENQSVDVNDTDRLLLEKNYSALLSKAVARLPAQQKEVYKLIREQGMRRDQVAAQMGISPGTVKQHLTLAMRSIRAFCMSRLELYIAITLFNHFNP